MSETLAQGASTVTVSGKARTRTLPLKASALTNRLPISYSPNAGSYARIKAEFLLYSLKWRTNLISHRLVSLKIVGGALEAYKVNEAV